MSAEIKCTYESCSAQFTTLQAMKKHKEKDSEHFYCKKCDLDFEDDLELLYHEIVSDRHMACPVCGAKFKSESGRDRHVEIDHVPKQKVDCMGCQMNFDKAAGLIRHIESDSCPVIKNHYFQRQKAEKQILQDAWDAAMDPTAGTTILSNARVLAPIDNEMNLLDDERAYVNTDWQGRPIHDEEFEQNGPYVDAPSDMMSNLSLKSFPVLGPQSRTYADRLPHSNTGTIRLPDISNNDPIAGLPHVTEQAASTNLYDSFIEEDIDNHPRNNYNTSKQPAPKATPSNPTSSQANISTFQPRNNLPLSALHDPVLNTYVCPSPFCGRYFPSQTSFTAHLLHPPHAGVNVVCPGCYKKFKNTTALISHVESGSRKCRVKESSDVDRVVRELTAGMVSVDGVTDEGAVRFVSRPVTEW